MTIIGYSKLGKYADKGIYSNLKIYSRELVNV